MWLHHTRSAEKQRSGSDEQIDADLSQAQHKFGYLKGPASDVRLNPTNPKGLTDQ